MDIHLQKNNLGRKGEQLAEHFLTKNGYQIIGRNFRLRNGEIDIIAIENPEDLLNDKTLIFIEVKTRTTEDFGTPLEAITYYKLKALIRSAEVYKTSHKNYLMPCASTQWLSSSIQMEHW